MENIEKQITGDWIDLREASKDLYSLVEYLKPERNTLNRLITQVNGSIEEGIIEYKYASLMPVFMALENMKYQSLNAEEMYKQELNTKALLLIISLQRMLSQGAVPLSTSKTKAEKQILDIDVTTIVSAIKARINKNPEIKQHPAVKQILIQINRYQREYEKMRELLPKIKFEVLPSFLSNFINVFDSIFTSIRKNYSEIIAEEEEKEKDKRVTHLLPVLPMKKITPIFETQAREISRMRSVLSFAREERYKTREILVKLYNDKTKILETIDRERTAYKGLCANLPPLPIEENLRRNCYSRILMEFKKEIVILLQRIIKSY